MMRAILAFLAWGPCVLAAAGEASPPVRPPVCPELTPRQGQALVRRARRAMSLYLTRRIDARSMPVPDALAALRARHDAAAVTLRQGSEVVAVEIRAGRDLCTHVAAAAQRAMRSHRLPDRIDPKVLDALLVEVEVFSALRQVDRSDLPKAFVPGLTGVAYFRGDLAASLDRRHGVSWVLPSAGYVLGLDAEGLRRAAMGRFRLTGDNASAPSRLGVFATRHYVGFPDGRVVELFRGKKMSLRAKVDGQALAAAADKVGAFLARHQDEDGRYHAPAARETLADHLYAAWAMARLARRRPDPRLARSAALAIRHGVQRARRGDGRALVEDSAPDATLRTTALLALAMGQVDPGTETRRLRADLLRGLLAELPDIAPSSRPTSRPTSRPASRPAPSAGPWLALLALGDGRALGEAGARQVQELRKAWRQVRPTTAAGVHWACRAGLGSRSSLLAGGGPDGGGNITQAGAERPADEIGGFAEGGAGPSTVLTGMRAACIARALKGSPAGAAEMRRARIVLTAARKFCFGMMYQAPEAYFAREPDAWLGGVREGPGTARVTVSACAAAIEAFLAE